MSGKSIPNSRRTTKGGTSGRPVRRGAGGKFTSTKAKSAPVEEVDELEGSAVSVEEAEPEEEEVETTEVEEDLDEDEAEEYEDDEEDEDEDAEDEYDEDDEEDEEDEDEDPISEKTHAAVREQMESTPEVEPVKIRRLTIAEIRMANDITEEPYYVEEWEGEVLLRSPSARKLIGMIKDSGQGKLTVDNGQASTDEVDFDVMLEELVKMSVVDPVIDEEAYQMILDKSAGALFGIFGEIRKIAKLDRLGNDGKKVDAVKEEEKRFRKG